MVKASYNTIDNCLYVFFNLLFHFNAYGLENKIALKEGGEKSVLLKFLLISSRGGLVVELWTDNSLPSATVD